MCVYKFIKILIISPVRVDFITFEVTLINKTYSIYNEIFNYYDLWHTFAKFLPRRSMNPLKMYKYFRQRDCAYHLPAIAMQIYTTSIVPLFIKSSPYPLIQTRDDISHIEYPPPPPPVLRVTKYARAISRYATGRLRIIYTRLSLRPCFFSRLCYDHVGSSQRVVLLEQKIIFGTVALCSRERKKKKNRKKGGRGIQPSIFPTILRVDVISRSRARKWTSHAGCDTLRLNGRRFKNEKLLVQLQRYGFAGDRFKMGGIT